MANIKIEIKNLDKLTAAFKKSPKLIKDEMEKAMGNISWYVVTQTKEHIRMGTDMWKAPLDTGAMMRGISPTKISPFESIITPSDSTPYAIYVHEGTRHMKDRPFFEVTAKRSKEGIEERANQVLNNVAERLCRL